MRAANPIEINSDLTALDPRVYWAEQMEEAYAFMQRLLLYPLAECRESMVSIREKARDAGLRIDLPDGLKLGALERTFFLRSSVMERLLGAAEAMLRRGWVLRIEDAYRSLAVQARGTTCDFIVSAMRERALWERDGQEPSMELLMRRIAVMTATTPKFANHMSGSAIDLSVVDAATGREVDRGGRYLDISERTPMASPFISARARRNRDAIADLLGEHGFLPYPYEFWHFSHGDADYGLLTGDSRPARYGPVHLNPQSGAVEPVCDVLANLLDEDGLRRKLQAIIPTPRPVKSWPEVDTC